jgi:hypothetical protein
MVKQYNKTKENCILAYACVQSDIMANPDTLATLSTQDTGRRQAKQITQHKN